MITRPIPSTGEPIPVIGLGTWQTFDVGDAAAERKRLAEVLRRFADAGGRVIDSSPMYGRAESVVGDIVSEFGLRDRLFLATKVWTTGQSEGVAQMKESMRRMKADRLDLIQVHNLLDVEVHLDTLEAWKREKRVRYVGITHYAASHHEAVARVLRARTVDTVQINYSVEETEAERTVLPLARDRGVAVIVNRPLAQGALLRRLKGRPLPSWAAEWRCDSWAALLLKFVISHPAVTCAIPATSQVSHLAENLQAGEEPFPDEKGRARIAAAARDA